jgi:HSP20 family protein
LGQKKESEVIMAQEERKDRMQRTTSTENREQRGLQPNRERGETAWRDPFEAFWRDPFSLFQRDVWPFARGERSPFGHRAQRDYGLWSPQIEAFQRGDQFVVRADLPGLKKEDVNIELTEDSLVIQGERRDQREEEREGYYRSERSYGSFYRTVPLPEGAITESAKANFNDGVLEITVQAPPREVSHRRRIEISDSTQAK